MVCLTVPFVRCPQVAPAKLILLSEMCSYDFKPKDSVICEEGSVSANVYATPLSTHLTTSRAL